MNGNEKTEIVEIDFSGSKISEIKNLSTDTSISLKVAVSTMLSPSETFIYYEKLFNYIAKKINRPIEFKQRRTYEEVNTLLKNNQVDLAFICSGAYIDMDNKSIAELIAIPVCDGIPQYSAYILVNNSSGIEKFEDLRGKSFAFVDELSNTGKLYAEKRVKELNSTPEKYFKKIIYSNAHDISIQFVAKKIVSGATVDGLIFEYIKQKFPERVKDIRIIEKSEYYGIPPVVCSKAMDDDLKIQIKEVLFNIHIDSVGKEILDKLRIDKFIEGHDEDYNSIREMRMFIKE